MISGTVTLLDLRTFPAMKYSRMMPMGGAAKVMRPTQGPPVYTTLAEPVMPPPPHQVASSVPTRTMKGIRCPPVTISSEVLTFLWATISPKIMSSTR